jgi:hypothetical protein
LASQSTKISLGGKEKKKKKKIKVKIRKNPITKLKVVHKISQVGK